jgi:MFS family permease
VILTIGLGFTYGPQAALYAELFPASIRFSGVSISYAIGAILGGAFAPTIAQAIVQATGGTGGHLVPRRHDALGLSPRCCCATAAASRSAPTTRPSSR